MHAVEPKRAERAERARVLIAGGRVAGIEAAAALSALVPDICEVGLIASEPDFIYRPLLVNEPFDGSPAPRYELGALLAELGAEIIHGILTAVDEEAREVHLEGGRRRRYDALVICTGAASVAAYPGVVTLGAGFPAFDADDLIDAAMTSVGNVLTLVVPPGTSWPLPLYELSLMLRHRAQDRELERLRIKILTPEDNPLAIFGRPASDALGELLDRAEIDVEASMYVIDDEGIATNTTLGTPLPRACPVVSLPNLEGRAVPGLPRDPSGFLPIDDTCRVQGQDDVFAAGDGTTFPIKQGGLATQQADVAAERIAGGGGETSVARGVLWSPPEKISGRYLGEALAGGDARLDVDSDLRPLPIGVSWPPGFGTTVSGNS